MNNCRNRLAIAFIAVMVTLICSVGAWPQSLPTLKIVVPYPPASGPDILSRLMAEQIGRMSGPTVVVENRPGGGTLIGTEAVQRAAPDGATVLLVANSFVVNPALKKLGYDPATSFEPVCYLAATPMLLVVNSASPYRTLADFVEAARAQPGKLSMASVGRRRRSISALRCSNARPAPRSPTCPMRAVLRRSTHCSAIT
jgi:tripartite-type tricarboxylate transporter receptor subunit TctC